MSAPVCKDLKKKKLAKELGPGLPHITVYLFSPSVGQPQLQYVATSCSGPLLL